MSRHRTTLSTGAARSPVLAALASITLGACGGGTMSPLDGALGDGAHDDTSVTDGARADGTAADTLLDVPMDTPCANPDMDGDGVRSVACGGTDCDDHDPHRFPGNPEVCRVVTVASADGGTTLTRTDLANGIDPTHDEDCDPTTFANGMVGDGDHDGDGYVDVTCSNTDQNGMRYHGTDCADLGPVAAVPASLMLSVAPSGVHPTAMEVCNGVDDNCDGQIDEGNPGGGGSCGSGRPGVCAAGTSQCTSGALACPPNRMPSPELCDGLDNDCNGLVDDGDPGGGAVCVTGMTGVCAAGTQHCVSAMIQCLRDMGPASSETYCNGLDDDCNPATPDVPVGACYTGPGGTEGVGICRDGTWSCSGGTASCGGETLPQPSETYCNGLDDDCTPSTPDTPSGSCYTGPAGTSGVGACHGGTQGCSGSTVSCNAEQLPQTELCNGVDDDCNGTVDDVWGSGTRPARACVYGSTAACAMCAGDFPSAPGYGYPGTDSCNNASCQLQGQCVVPSVVGPYVVSVGTTSATNPSGGYDTSTRPLTMLSGTNSMFTDVMAVGVGNATLWVQHLVGSTWVTIATQALGTSYNGNITLSYAESTPCAQERLVLHTDQPCTGSGPGVNCALGTTRLTNGGGTYTY